MSNLLKTRSALGVAARSGDPDRIENAQRAHAAAKIETAIQHALSSAPPLSAEQRDRLASLLTPTGGASS